MGRNTDIVRFRHDGDFLCLADTSSMGNVGLDDVYAAQFEIWSDVFSGEETFAELDPRFSYQIPLQEGDPETNKMNEEGRGEGAQAERESENSQRWGW